MHSGSAHIRILELGHLLVQLLVCLQSSLVCWLPNARLTRALLALVFEVIKSIPICCQIGLKVKSIV